MAKGFREKENSRKFCQQPHGGQGLIGGQLTVQDLGFDLDFDLLIGGDFALQGKVDVVYALWA